MKYTNFEMPIVNAHALTINEERSELDILATAWTVFKAVAKAVAMGILCFNACSRDDQAVAVDSKSDKAYNK